MSSKTFNCTNCGQEIEIEESQTGAVQCPLCLKTITIPSFSIESNIELADISTSSKNYYVPGSMKKLWNLQVLFMLIGFIIIPFIFLVWDILNGSGSIVADKYNLQVDFEGISILILSVLNFVCMIIGVIIASVLLYRFWNIIQSGSNTRTTPGRAVGFTFIPIFNIYWFYVSYVGLAKDMNTYCVENNIDERINEALAKSWYFLTILSIIPVLGIVIGVIAIILYLIMMKKFSTLSEIIINR
jgi:hypothetical protein